ncbi:MAG: hypothetical protein HQ567_09920 [Candidatus Nealsonbacteria bacterium]|nr:hypothetical protein [Candidatus Nealsonbacteria bacterium]
MANVGVQGEPGFLLMCSHIENVSVSNLERQMNPGRPAFTRITLKDKGLTSDASRIWSGVTLMDLDRYQALKMTVKKIGGDDYLFIEAGGFSTRNPVGWQSPWYVMKSQTK